MAPLPVRFARGLRSRIAYRRIGAGAPVYLVHGITGNSLTWDAVARQLAARYDVISIDARGHGHSAHTAGAYSWRCHVADLLALLDYFGHQRAAFVGWSMGAENVALLAAQRPERVRCLVLEDPPWTERSDQTTSAQRQQRATQWRVEVVADASLPVDERLQLMRDNKPWLNEAGVRAQVAARERLDFDVLSWLLDRIPWSVFAHQIRCPTLLVRADEALGGIVTATVAAQVLARSAMAGANTVTARHVAGAGHAIHEAQEQRFMRAVVSFLAAHGRGAHTWR